MWIYEPPLKHLVLKILPFLTGERKGDKKKMPPAFVFQFQSTIKENQDIYPDSKARLVKEEEWANPNQVPAQHE